MVRPIFRRSKWYPRVHDIHSTFAMSPTDDVAGEPATAIQTIRYDEGLGDPASFNSNPDHPSYAVSNGGGCYPESYVSALNGTIHFALNPALLGGDHIIKVGYMVASLAFDNDYEADDQMSGEMVQDVLSLLHEDSDRQGYIDYSGTKVIEQYSDSALQEATQPDLTTNQRLEGIVFDFDKYYDALHYGKHGGKLKKVTSGIRWLTLSKQTPWIKIPIFQKAATKFLNEYAGHYVYMFVPEEGTKYQPFLKNGDTDINDYVHCSYIARYSEQNEYFDHSKT